MKLFINIFGISLPSYGFMIAIGFVAGNLPALLLMKKKKDDANDFMILESVGVLGAFLGAKLLYLLVSWREIIRLRPSVSVINQVMQSGFVFYGGVAGAIVLVGLGGVLFQLDARRYLKNYIFMIPIFHGFGRIGCFLAGCCYGIPYRGAGAVIFPERSLAVSGVQLFPVQLVEAALLFLLAAVLLGMSAYETNRSTVEIYLTAYAIMRFLLEFLRYDSQRGKIGELSTSQWFSLGVVSIVLIRRIKLKWKRKQKFA